MCKHASAPRPPGLRHELLQHWMNLVRDAP